MRNDQVIAMVGFSLGWLVINFRHAQCISDRNMAEFHSGAS